MKFTGKMCFKIILKFTTNQGSTLSIEDTFFKKPQEGQFDPPSPPLPGRLGLIDLHLSLSKVSFMLHQIAIFISSLYKSFLCSCSYCCCIIYLTSCLMYAHVMLMSINQCLLNVAFSSTKALYGQIFPKQHFYYPHLSMLFGKLYFS